jgi:hypothetical protein
MIKFTNWQGELKRLTNSVNNLGVKKADDYRTLVRETLRMLAKVSPQYSGYYASNWRISFSGGGALTEEDQFATEITAEALRGQYQDALSYLGPLQKGDEKAVAVTMDANEPAIQKIKSMYTKVVFYNPTSYAQIIAKNKDPNDPKWQLRPVNVTSPTPIPIGHVKAHLPEILAKLPKGARVVRK